MFIFRYGKDNESLSSLTFTCLLFSGIDSLSISVLIDFYGSRSVFSNLTLLFHPHLSIELKRKSRSCFAFEFFFILYPLHASHAFINRFQIWFVTTKLWSDQFFSRQAHHRLITIHWAQLIEMKVH